MRPSHNSISFCICLLIRGFCPSVLLSVYANVSSSICPSIFLFVLFLFLLLLKATVARRLFPCLSFYSCLLPIHSSSYLSLSFSISFRLSVLLLLQVSYINHSLFCQSNNLLSIYFPASIYMFLLAYLPVCLHVCPSNPIPKALYLFVFYQAFISPPISLFSSSSSPLLPSLPPITAR